VPLAADLYETQYTVYRHDPWGQGFRMNVRDETAVMRLVASLRPDVIIHTVGSNRVEKMAQVIEQGTRNMTAAAGEVGARLVHVSTDVVFDGHGGPYREEDPVSPLHGYGRAKAAAEVVVAQHTDHVIIRTSLIYGLERMDRGTAWVAKALQMRHPVTLFTDQLRNPVWVNTLCQACLELASLDYRGILHVAGEQAMSRAEFGLRMLDWWGIGERDTLQLGLSDPQEWPADCRLDVGRAKALLLTPLPGVDTVLKSA